MIKKHGIFFIILVCSIVFISSAYATPYITGFNGYTFGTPMEEILKAATHKIREGGLLNGYTLKTVTFTNLENSFNRRFVESHGFKIRDGFQYHCAISNDPNKYPIVCYVSKDGRMLAGSFGYEWYDSLSETILPHIKRIEDIREYVLKNISGTTQTVEPLHNAFGAVLQNKTHVVANDDGGSITILTLRGVGLRKNSPDGSAIIVLSKEYLDLTKEPEKPTPQL
ncbi:MAG: hypothetical protein Q4F74_02510 [Synergistaceae bacterium]|nr:hypothetical protein [Synergistaceae bacterium]